MPNTEKMDAYLVHAAAAAVVIATLCLFMWAGGRALDADHNQRSADGAAGAAELDSLLLEDWRRCTAGLPPAMRVDVCGVAP